MIDLSLADQFGLTVFSGTNNPGIRLQWRALIYEGVTDLIKGTVINGVPCPLSMVGLLTMKELEQFAAISAFTSHSRHPDEEGADWYADACLVRDRLQTQLTQLSEQRRQDMISRSAEKLRLAPESLRGLVFDVTEICYAVAGGEIAANVAAPLILREVVGALGIEAPWEFTASVAPNENSAS